MLYNEELKLRYISEKEREVIFSKNFLKCIFEKIAAYEADIGKDASCFTTYEIIEYYKISNNPSIDSLYVLNSQLKMYTQWCLQKNLVIDNQNHYLEMNFENLKSCVNKAFFNSTIITRKTLINWLSYLPNARDQFILLSLFEFGKSINFAETLNAKISDIDRNKMVLHGRGDRLVNISDELRSIALDSSISYDYMSISGNAIKTMTLIGDDDIIVKRYPNFRETSSEFQKGRSIYNCLMRCFDYIGVDNVYSANSLVESGKLNMIKEEAYKNNMDPRSYIYSPLIINVENQYNCNIVRSTYIVKYEEYL